MIAKTYPMPNLAVTKVPTADKEVANILGKSFPAQRDKELRKIQAGAPLADLWSWMTNQGFSDKPEKLMPTSE